MFEDSTDTVPGCQGISSPPFKHSPVSRNDIPFSPSHTQPAAVLARNLSRNAQITRNGLLRLIHQAKYSILANCCQAGCCDLVVRSLVKMGKRFERDSRLQSLSFAQAMSGVSSNCSFVQAGLGLSNGDTELPVLSLAWVGKLASAAASSTKSAAACLSLQCDCDCCRGSIPNQRCAQLETVGERLRIPPHATMQSHARASVGRLPA